MKASGALRGRDQRGNYVNYYFFDRSNDVHSTNRKRCFFRRTQISQVFTRKLILDKTATNITVKDNKKYRVFIIVTKYYMRTYRIHRYS